jgi:hypothetical protein
MTDLGSIDPKDVFYLRFDGPSFDGLPTTVTLLTCEDQSLTVTFSHWK